MPVAIKIENLSKQYRLGMVSTRTLSHDLNRWYKMKILGKEDPYLKVGEVNETTVKAATEYVWALRDINFEVQEGEVLGIIGKNGAGKSTLLKILSKVTAPTTGTIKARGRIASLLEVGTGFHPEMTGRENIFMNGAILGMTKGEIQGKFDEIVDFSGVEKFVDTPVKRYSSGMIVRLGFAVAAHLDPEILVVDEVLAVGDAEFQRKAIGKMQDISGKQGKTVLFVSHNLFVIQNICPKTILLSNGKIVHQGSTEEIIRCYLNTVLSLKSIEERTDRIGNGKILINKIEILNSKNIPVDHLLVGEDCTFKLYYRSKLTETENENILVGISVKNELDMPVFLHHSRMNGVLFNLVGKQGIFLLKLENLAIAAADYILGYSIMNINGTEYFDSIDHALRIRVINGRIYNYSEIPPSSHGPALVKGKWDLQILQ